MVQAELSRVPLSQTRAVTVGTHGLTHVEFDFDTGIRQR
jgi:hypothetical protein